MPAAAIVFRKSRRGIVLIPFPPENLHLNVDSIVELIYIYFIGRRTSLETSTDNHFVRK